jgi:hypothetical protein
MSGVTAPSLDALDLSDDCEINDPADVPDRDRGDPEHEQDEIPADEWRGEVGQPSERELQQALIEWADHQPGPAQMLFAVPNGQYRPGQAPEPGLRAGVPDLCLPWHDPDDGVLFIELKVGSNSTTSAQDEWIGDLIAAGNTVKICRRLDDAIEIIQDHITHA